MKINYFIRESNGIYEVCFRFEDQQDLNPRVFVYSGSVDDNAPTLDTGVRDRIINRRLDVVKEFVAKANQTKSLDVRILEANLAEVN